MSEVNTSPPVVRLVAGSLWRHYGGTIYRVLNVGLDTETNNAIVIYQREEGGVWFSRPIGEFLGHVARTSRPGYRPRFESMEPDHDPQ